MPCVSPSSSQTSSALPALDVAQPDHRALRRRELLDRLVRPVAASPARAAARRAASPTAAAAPPRTAGSGRAGPGSGRGRPRGSSPPVSAATTAENGTLRASRSPRVLARLVRMRNSQVFNVERSSKRSRPLTTASHVSCTTSSAAWRSRTCSRATRSIVAWWRPTSVRKARSSPRRSRARSSSVGVDRDLACHGSPRRYTAGRWLARACQSPRGDRAQRAASPARPVPRLATPGTASSGRRRAMRYAVTSPRGGVDGVQVVAGDGEVVRARRGGGQAVRV